MNKMDKPEAQPERVKQQLAENGLQSVDWGGNPTPREALAIALKALGR